MAGAKKHSNQNPIPEEYGMGNAYMEATINEALAADQAGGVHGKNITPFLLARIKERYSKLFFCR